MPIRYSENTTRADQSKQMRLAGYVARMARILPKFDRTERMK
jgi:hypothetical protein